MRLVREIVWQLVNAWMLANANYEMLKFFATCFLLEYPERSRKLYKLYKYAIGPTSF